LAQAKICRSRRSWTSVLAMVVAENEKKPPSKSLTADDTTRTVSKMLSWLLRHGIKHRSVGLPSNEEGWIKMSDVLATDYFKEVSKDTLMKVIIDSNSQKPRYQLSPDCVHIRAYSAQEQKVLKGTPVETKTKPSGKQSAAASAAPAAAAAADEEEKKGTGLRGDAPEFVPGKTPVPTAPAIPGYPFPYYGMMPQMMPYMPVQVVSRNATAGPSARELGRIKSFNEEKGFGFIECARVTQQFGRDLFVHKAQMNGFKVGDEVTLAVTLNEAGLPQAKDLLTVTGASPGGKGKEKGKGKGKSKDNSDAKGKGKGKQDGKSGGKSKKGKGKKKGNDNSDDDDDDDNED